MKSLGAIISWFILLSAVIGVGIIIAIQMVMAAGPLQEDTTVLIEKGAGVNGISSALEQKGVINSPLTFKIASRFIGDPTKMKAGEYRFNAGISVAGVLDKLQSGQTVQRAFTIPEGLTSYEVVQILNNEEALTGEIETIPEEGSLLPETYNYQYGDMRSAKIRRMQQNMQEAIDELWPNRAGNLPFDTKEEALTLASIVEKETAVPDERDRVAGVFINRLREGMRLQTDPTVLYALHEGRPENKGKGPIGRRLLREDLDVESPYNTYVSDGLPPGPIANPGRASIAATLNPEEHDYLYFVADGTGGHIFAETLEEHNYNAMNWRKIRDKRREEEENSEALFNNPPEEDE